MVNILSKIQDSSSDMNKKDIFEPAKKKGFFAKLFGK